MIAAVIDWSVRNRLAVALATLVLVAVSSVVIRNTAVDAIPDLSDVQVIIKTSYPGQAPQIVEDQITYPLTTALMAVPGAQTVRGFSFFGDSYIYVLFDEDTNLYWARSRVLEYLGQVASSLPAGVKPQLGPDATGVGWIYMYSLVDRSGLRSLAELRSLQDWWLKFELQAVEGVAEVATVGGMVRQYQVRVDPQQLRAYGLTLDRVTTAVQRGSQEVGASVIEQAEAEYLIRSRGYIENREDLLNLPLGAVYKGTPLLLRQVATVELGPAMRRGIAELNGEGETVAGIIVMRSGGNAAATIARVQRKLDELAASLPDGVEVVPVYDRSKLIERAVNNLVDKLFQEILVVSLVCLLFLLHFRSSLVVILTLPVGVLAALVVMTLQGVNANIMSLGGIAVAIGAMVDGAIVMVENLHRQIEKHPPADAEERWDAVRRAASQVGPPLFFSLLIITVSFIPVFALQAQEGRMFAPLAYTKTYAMAAAAMLTITLVPVLMGYLIRGRIRPERDNPINRLLLASYLPALRLVLRFPKTTLLIAVLLTIGSLWPLSRLGSEFMPPLDEGDLMYMPTTYPGLSVGKARELLQQTNRMIRTVPEVESVFGKIGRADTATDPAPLTMIETLIQFKPRSEWREGVNTDSLIAELDSRVQVPGLTNAWVMPIKTRIDMLATGIKTPVGVKVAGPDLTVIQSIGRELEAALRTLPGTVSVFSERVSGGRYIEIDTDRVAAARYGLNMADVQAVIATAVGGVNVGYSVEGRERYPINIRYPQAYRQSVGDLEGLPLITPSGQQLSLGMVADIRIVDGPPMIKSENARINGWTFVDIAGVDVGTYVEQARRLVAAEVVLPPGYSLSWAGQFEYLQRAQARLLQLVPMTLLIIVVLLYASSRRLQEVLMILASLPLAAVGGIWLLYLSDYNLSVAVGVGFIALAGVAVEIGMIMLAYLNAALGEELARAERPAPERLVAAVMSGAGRRIRPVMMTVLATVAGLLPLLSATGTGAEIMTRMAAPMVGGLITALLLNMLVLPAIFLLWQRHRLTA